MVLKPAIPAHRRQKQEDHCKFKASLGYRMSSGSAWARVRLSQKTKNKEGEWDRGKKRKGGRQRGAAMKE